MVRDLPLLLKTLGADYKHELIGRRLRQHTSFCLHEKFLRVATVHVRLLQFRLCVAITFQNLLLNRFRRQNSWQQRNKELLLIAQDSTFMVLDLYKERKLASLMEQLCTVDGIEDLALYMLFLQGFQLMWFDVMQRETKSVSI